MNIRNPLHVGGYLLLIGLMLWLILAVSHGIFLPSVPQAQDYCSRWVLIPDGIDAPERLVGSSHRCIEFINTLERLKYYHNLRMVKRNRILLYIIMGAGIITSFLLFYAIPKWRKRKYFQGSYSYASGVIGLGMLAAFSPILYGFVLPSPSKWFPDKIVKYIDSKEIKEIHNLQKQAKELDNKWINYQEGTFTDIVAGLEPDGFREIKWGQHVSTVLGMTEYKPSNHSSNTNDFFIRNNEDLNLGDAKLNNIVYFFPKGRFCSVFMTAHGINNWKALREKFIKELGNGGTFTETVCFWFGYRCSVELRYEASSDLVILEISQHSC
jgi:hypothetical protein